MKILMLISSLDCGGAETHVVTLAESLSRQGHTVTVASGGGREAVNLAKKGVRHILIELGTHNPIKLLKARKKLTRLIAEYMPEVIHAHSRIAALLGSSIARKRRIAFVSTAHAKFRVNFLFLRFSRWGSPTIAVSEDLKQYLCENYKIFPDNVFVIPNGIDTEHFAPAKEKNHNKLKVCFASRLDSDCSEAAIWLCRSAPLLNKCIEGLEIVICGGGDANGKVLAEAERANKAMGRRCVELLGRVDDMAPVLQSTDIFVGASRAALEAMSTGALVVLCGNEGFFGEVSPENFCRAREENFCCRRERRGNAELLFREILKLVSMDIEAKSKRSAALREAVCALNGSDEVAFMTEQVYKLAKKRVPDTRGEIVLCGFYGFGNLGDDSLLMSAIKKSRRLCENASISALTRRGRRDSEHFGVRCISRSNPFAIAKEIKRADAFVFGGGTLLQENSSRRSLLYYIALLRYAQHCGVRCELWGNGIGSPRSERSAALMTKAICRCSYVGLRDIASVKLLRELCTEFKLPMPPTFFERDLALMSVGTSPSRTAFLLRKYSSVTANPKGFAVVAVSGNAGKGFLELFSRKLFEFSQEGKALLFVPMFPEEDRRISRKLAESFGGCVAEPLSGTDLVGIMSRAEGVYGMRLHSLIFAFLAGTEFVGFGEDTKIESFCRENGGSYYTDLF